MAGNTEKEKQLKVPETERVPLVGDVVITADAPLGAVVLRKSKAHRAIGVAVIRKLADGSESLGFAMTQDMSHVKEIIGHWDTDRIVKAFFQPFLAEGTMIDKEKMVAFKAELENRIRDDGEV